jgi:hypothetical protein
MGSLIKTLIFLWIAIPAELIAQQMFIYKDKNGKTMTQAQVDALDKQYNGYLIIEFLSDEVPMVVQVSAPSANELKLIKRLNGCVIWVRRGELPEWYNDAAQANNGNAASKKIMQTRYRDIHESEWNWVGFECDHVIFNNGTVDDLEHAVLEIKKSIQTANTL